MVCWTSREVRDGSGDPRLDPRWVERLSGRTWTGRGTLGEVRKGWGSLEEVRDISLDRQGGPGLVTESAGRSGTGRGILKEVWDVLGDPRGGSWTHREVRDGLLDPTGDLGRVK